LSKKRTRHSTEQVVKKLRDADAMLAAGKSVGEVLQVSGDSANHAAARYDLRCPPSSLAKTHACFFGPMISESARSHTGGGKEV
jgi:hypothetical protein